MGETHFKIGEPKPRNEAARERVEALTIYDSRYNQETLLATAPMRVKAGTTPAAIFTIAVTALLVTTLIIL